MQNNPFTTVTIEFYDEGIKSVTIDGHDITSAVDHVGVSARPNRRSTVLVELDPDVLKVSGNPYMARLVHSVIIDEPERFTLWKRVKTAYLAAREAVKGNS